MVLADSEERHNPEINYRKRVRINVSTSTKGVFTFDATYEQFDCTDEEILENVDNLIAELTKRFGPELPPFYVTPRND